MNSTPPENKEWKTLLEELSELEKKYRAVLQELDETRRQLQAQNKQPSEQHIVQQSSPAPPQPKPSPTTASKSGLLSRMKISLQNIQAGPATAPSQPLPTTSERQYFAVCSRCQSRIIHATRFCENCGADFGGLVCSCGRGLDGQAKFCDRCGRGVEQSI